MRDELVSAVSVDRLAPFSVLLDEEVDVHEYRHVGVLVHLCPGLDDFGVPSESYRSEDLCKLLDSPHRVDVALTLESSCLDGLLSLGRNASYSLIDREVVLLDLLVILHICKD